MQEKLYKFTYWKDDIPQKRFFGTMWEMLNFASQQEDIRNQDYFEMSGGKWIRCKLIGEFY